MLGVVMACLGLKRTEDIFERTKIVFEDSTKCTEVKFVWSVL